MTTVSKVMETKLITIDINDSVSRAQEIMRENRIGCLPVLNNGELAGIITTWDTIVSKPDDKIADAMTTPVISVEPTTSIWEAKELMEKKNIERLIVLENDQLVGLVTKTNLFCEVATHYDILTQLNKKDYLIYQGVKLLENGHEISVIFIDLDGFGEIDKEYGHMYGDYILKEIGNLLKEAVPKDCFLCRYAGDEFAVLTPYEQERCIELARYLLEIISNEKYGIERVGVTGSAGIAGGRRHPARSSLDYADDVENLFNLASLASTKAKRIKKRIVVAEGLNYKVE